ncbi:hypothetical protein MMC21_005650 [Puttea exsequens]|nr:hypothetical protein [Puttea exsequens]
MTSPDTNNFFSSSPHRLPTVSASEALQRSGSASNKPLSTGIDSLDAALQNRDVEFSTQHSSPGGLRRGEVAEVYGPPGVGKTAFAMQVTALALQSSSTVVWVDASATLAGSRLRELITANASLSPQSPTDGNGGVLKSFCHYTTPTLPHLLALLAYQSNSFPPANTSLLVIDGISTLLALALPRKFDDINSLQPTMKKSDAAQWASGRRWAVMGDMISKFGRLAATRNLAVLLTCQTTTRIRSETGAVLHPAISGNAWDSGISTRIVLCRDWMFNANDTQNSQRGEGTGDFRFAGVMKNKGVTYEGVGRVVAFRIENDGLREIQIDQAEVRLDLPPDLPPVSIKRKREEIANSESDEEGNASDQEFGWAGDEALNADHLLG